MKNHPEIAVESPQILSEAELEHSLHSAGVPVDTWGKGEAKNIADLYEEICNGETQLTFLPDGNVERKVGVVWVDVFYADHSGAIYHLVEDRQEFEDGRIRHRELPGSLGEKLKPEENPDSAMQRALQEELGVSSICEHHATGESTEQRIAPSYPGLSSTFSMYSYATILNYDAYKPEGYVEVQPGKTNYFVWEQIK